jgi:hypothetical protein
MHRRRLLPALAVAGLLPGVAGAGLPAPPVFEWSRCPAGFCDTGWYASPAAGDVDGDGQVEVLWGGYRLLAVDGGSGALEWTYPPAGNDGRLWPSPAIADLGGDGPLEIVIANGSGQVVVLDGGGSPRPGFPVQPFPSGEIRSLAVADLDGDGDLEILVARAASGSLGQWSVLEHAGAVRDGWPQHTAASPGYAAGCYNQNLAAADLDGDGEREVVATSDVHYAATFTHRGAERKAAALFGLPGGVAKDWSEVGVHFDQTWDVQGWADCNAPAPVQWRPNLADSAPVVADLDGDGTPEIVFVGNFYEFCDGPYTSLFQGPVILNADRTRWAAGAFDWTQLPVPDGAGAPLSQDYEEIESVQPNPAIADLDGDGVAEILYPSYDGRLHAMWLDKSERHGWPIDLNPGAGPLRFASEPVAADLDGDGKLEVLFHVWTEKGSGQDGELRIVDWQGNALAAVPIPRDGDTWSGALGAPTIANVDADPELEVLSGTTSVGLVAHELPGTAGARIAWATSRGDFTRAAPEPGGGVLAVAALATLSALARRRRCAWGGPPSRPAWIVRKGCASLRRGRSWPPIPAAGGRQRPR